MINLYLNSDGFKTIESRVAYIEDRDNYEAEVYCWDSSVSYGRDMACYIKRIDDDPYIICRVYRYGEYEPVCGVDGDGVIHLGYNRTDYGTGKIIDNCVYSDMYANYTNRVGTIDECYETWISYGGLAALWLVIGRNCSSVNRHEESHNSSDGYSYSRSDYSDYSYNCNDEPISTLGLVMCIAPLFLFIYIPSAFIGMFYNFSISNETLIWIAKVDFAIAVAIIIILIIFNGEKEEKRTRGGKRR